MEAHSPNPAVPWLPYNRTILSTIFLRLQDSSSITQQNPPRAMASFKAPSLIVITTNESTINLANLALEYSALSRKGRRGRRPQTRGPPRHGLQIGPASSLDTTLAGGVFQSLLHFLDPVI